MISEAKMVHKLWNILEEKGYQVGREVRVVPDEKYSEIWDSKSVHEKIQPHVDAAGSIELKEKKEVSTTVDLVVIDGEKFTGFEFKDEFKAVESCISKRQLEHYIKGDMVDEIYLCIPSQECEHVKNSYGDYLKEIGIGLATLDESYNLSISSS